MGAKTRCNIFFHWPIIYEAQKIPWTDLGMCTKIGLWPIPIFRFRSKIAPWEINGLFHNFASEYSRDLVLMSNSRFMRIRHLGHFQKPQIVMWAKNRVEGLYEAKDNFKGWNWNLGIEQATNLVLASNPMFFWHVKSFGSIFMILRSTWRSRRGCTGCRMSRTTSRSGILYLFLNIVETHFWCQLSPNFLWDFKFVFEHSRDSFLVSIMSQFLFGKFVEIISMTFRSTWRVRTLWQGCRKPRMTWRIGMETLVLDIIDTCYFVSNWMFLVMRNHLG